MKDEDIFKRPHKEGFLLRFRAIPTLGHSGLWPGWSPTTSWAAAFKVVEVMDALASKVQMLSVTASGSDHCYPFIGIWVCRTTNKEASQFLIRT